MVGAISTIIVVVGAGYKLVKWIMGWGKDTDKWDRAATALEKLSRDVSELLYEVRGVNGKGGINSRLDGIDRDVRDIREDIVTIQNRNREADALVELYRLDLKQRADAGRPLRRQLDETVANMTQPSEGT